MLAQNFKTADQLRISEAGYAALLQVLGRLEREEIPANLFNMKMVGEPECGTPGCILGHTREIDMEAYEELRSTSYDSRNLEDLFFPCGDKTCNPYVATRSQAAMALRSYLTTGKPRWRVAMA